MADKSLSTPRQLYLDGLKNLAAEYGNDYSLLTAATTMASLLAMASMAMYRLSAPPLFLPSEAPPAKRKKH